MPGTLHLKSLEVKQMQALKENHPAFKYMEDSDIAHVLMQEGFNKIIKENPDLWGKTSKSLKEGVKSETQDGSVAQPGYSLSTYDIHTSQALPYMRQGLETDIWQVYEPQEAFLRRLAQEAVLED